MTLTLDPMTLTLQLDLDMVKGVLPYQNRSSCVNYFKVIAQTDRQAHTLQKH